jgi:site-specific recombinase XerD
MGIEEVQAILGHESIATTMIYAKVSKNNVKLHYTKCIV